MAARKIVTGVPAVQDGQGPAVEKVSDSFFARLFHLVQFGKWRLISLELNSKELYRSSEKENCCLVFTSSTKRENRKFHVVVEQRRQRNVQKSVIHVQSCCFAHLNPWLFCC